MRRGVCCRNCRVAWRIISIALRRFFIFTSSVWCRVSGVTCRSCIVAWFRTSSLVRRVLVVACRCFRRSLRLRLRFCTYVFSRIWIGYAKSLAFLSASASALA